MFLVTRYYPAALFKAERNGRRFALGCVRSETRNSVCTLPAWQRQLFAIRKPIFQAEAASSLTFAACGSMIRPLRPRNSCGSLLSARRRYT